MHQIAPNCVSNFKIFPGVNPHQWGGDTPPRPLSCSALRASTRGLRPFDCPRDSFILPCKNGWIKPCRALHSIARLTRSQCVARIAHKRRLSKILMGAGSHPIPSPPSSPLSSTSPLFPSPLFHSPRSSFLFISLPSFPYFFLRSYK